MKYYNELGENLRNVRKTRGMSLMKLSNRIAELFNVDISANLISMWERGERRVSVEHLNYLCKALDCTPNLICPGFNQKPSERLIEELGALPKNEQEILEFAATRWEGNSHALIQFCGLYMSLPRRLREGIAFMGLSLHEKGRNEHVIDPDVPDFSVVYIEEQWKKLLNRDN